MNREQKIDFYKCELFNYGFLTLAYLIDQYAEVEDYEECSIILDALQIVNNELGKSFPSQWNDKAILYFKDSFKKINGRDGKVALGNIPAYAAEIKAKSHF